ncbi:TPA: exosome complex exonuclease Rrp41 [Candidatus Woesearchaeota archaeon]|nr:exosome complex exonuclease Rrp41 [Candidatus Woesearchaeota archaeon]
MVYRKRLDGRKIDELRPVEAKVGVVSNADGSASFRIGKTWAIAAVYGPREIFPRFLQNPKRGILRCHYSMMPFSGSGERIRPGSNRRAQEISLVIQKSLEPVVDLSAFPNAVVDIFVELPQTDAGTRCAAISAASMALAVAGIPMKDLVSSVAVGKVDDKVVVDLDYMEEHIEEFNPESAAASVADIPVAMIHNTKEVTLLQMDGKVSKEDLIYALELAKKGIEQVYATQVKALKAYFPSE